MTTPAAPISREIFRRLLLALALAMAVGIGLAVWGYTSTNQRAVVVHLEAARTHYQSAIGILERRWGREAYNLRIRLETLRYLEDPVAGRDKVLAYLISQGGNIEFPSLRIENARGEPVLSYEYAGRRIPDAKFGPNQDTAWAWDPIQGRLYLVHRQFIWVGNANGRLLMYKPMDNALLTQLAYPETRLSLWWGDRAFASSEGNEGLDALLLPGKRPPALAMQWPGDGGAAAPSLLIESTSAPLLAPVDLALPMSVGFFALLISLWLTLGTWGRHILARLRALERAAENFLARRKIDDEIRRDLNAESGREHDEIAELAGSLERLMQAASEEGDPARRHNPG